jgi:RNA polymerase sigma-70 factor (ECF subfamily)
MTAATPYEDHELLRQIAQGDEPAFTILFERYRERIFVYLVKHTKNSAVAEEIVTDIFMKLWTGKELLSRIDNLPAFLHTVAYNKAMDFLRITARHERLTRTYTEKGAQENPRTPDALLIDQETKQILLQAIAQLPPQRQLIYRMSREEGLTHEQIAAALNLSRSTINNALVTSQRSIAQFLKDQGIGKAALSAFFILG